MSGQKSRTARRRRRRVSAQRQAAQRSQSGAAGRAGAGGIAGDALATASAAPAEVKPPSAAEAPAPAAAEVKPPPAPDAPAPASAEVKPPPAPEAPAPTEPAIPDIPEEPGFVGRSRLRRRLRYLRHLREIQLRDIGGFVLELHRFGRERPDLLQAKVALAAQTDAELRALERALSEGHAMREIREPGIGGACLSCGAVHGSEDRFCATCGEPLSGEVVDDTEGRPLP